MFHSSPFSFSSPGLLLLLSLGFFFSSPPPVLPREDVDLAAAVLDNGWRYMTIEGVKPGLSRNWLMSSTGWCLPFLAYFMCCARKCGPRPITDIWLDTLRRIHTHAHGEEDVGLLFNYSREMYLGWWCAV